MLKKKHSLIKKGDSRFAKEYYCCACGRPLVTYDPYKNCFSACKDLYNIRKGNDSNTMCKKYRDCYNYKVLRDHNDKLRIGVIK